MNYSALVMLTMMVLYFTNSLIWYFAHLIPMLFMTRHVAVVMLLVFTFGMVCIRLVQKVIY